MSHADIVLVDPPDTVAGHGGSVPGHLPNIGICLLAAVAEREGYRVAVIDAPALGWGHEAVLEELSRSGPRYVGFSAMTHNITSAALLARRARERIAGVRTILGGVHVSASAEATLEAFPDSFDVCVCGEGEATFAELLPALDQGADLAAVAGLAYRQAEAVVLTPPRAPIVEMDTLPMPAWHLLPDLRRHYGTTFISAGSGASSHLITSRGCPGRCIFCDTTVHGHRIRGYSAEYVLEMVDVLHRRYGISDIQFNDDTFVTLRKRLNAICEGLIRRSYDLTWSCDARASDVTREGLEMMRAAGCWQVAYGVETGSDRILKLLNKRVTFEQIHNAFRWTREAGIGTKAFFILGHPTETRESVRETVDLMLTLDIDVVGVTFFTAYPGSPVYPDIERYGDFDARWDMARTYEVGNFIPHGFSAEELIAIRRDALRRFYLRPRYALRQLRQVRSPYDIYKLAVGGGKAVRKFVFGSA